MVTSPRTKSQSLKTSAPKKAAATSARAHDPASRAASKRNLGQPVGNEATKTVNKPNRKAADEVMSGAKVTVRNDPAKATPPATTESTTKRQKLVRDSFTMPRTDFSLIETLKQRALNFRRPTKKSELLRAGLYALDAMDDASLHGALEALVSLKPGRPKKSP